MRSSISKSKSYIFILFATLIWLLTAFKFALADQENRVIAEEAISVTVVSSSVVTQVLQFVF